MNEEFHVFLRREIEETKIAIQKYQNKLKFLEAVKTDLNAWNSIKEYLIINEGKQYEDSYYEYITLRNESIDESRNELEGIHLKYIKKGLEVNENE